jgi:hypothetical protein
MEPMSEVELNRQKEAVTRYGREPRCDTMKPAIGSRNWMGNSESV